MKDLSIVIPLGVSTPGTPVLNYLKMCVENLKKQKTQFSYEIIFACDNNVTEEIKNYLKETGYHISWYDPFSFVRKGSIWKKIINEWQKVESTYIAFLHYDDLWDRDKIENQLNFMKNNNLDLSWSRVFCIDSSNNIISGDLCHRNRLNEESLDQSQTYAFSHSSVLNREKFLTSGILDYLEESAGIYEYLHFLFSHKMKGMKDESSAFFHRVHDHSITQNFSSEINPIESDFIKMTREVVNYSLDDVIEDAKLIPIEKIKNQIKNEIKISE